MSHDLVTAAWLPIICRTMSSKCLKSNEDEFSCRSFYTTRMFFIPFVYAWCVIAFLLFAVDIWNRDGVFCGHIQEK